MGGSTGDYDLVVIGGGAAGIAAVRAAVAAIAATETADVLAGEGIEVLRGRAAFVSRREIDVGGGRVRARAAVLRGIRRPLGGCRATGVGSRLLPGYRG